MECVLSGVDLSTEYVHFSDSVEHYMRMWLLELASLLVGRSGVYGLTATHVIPTQYSASLLCDRPQFVLHAHLDVLLCVAAPKYRRCRRRYLVDTQ